MRYLKFVLVLLFVLIFLPLCGCDGYNKDGIYYYENLENALSDINGECVGWRSRSGDGDSSVSVIVGDGVPTVHLLKNITTDKTVLLKNTNLDLGGFTLQNNDTTLITTYGKCRIYNGSLRRLCDKNNSCDGIIVIQKSMCEIDRVVFESKSLNQDNIAIRVYGHVFMRDSSVDALSAVVDDTKLTIGVYGNIFSNIHVETSSISAKADFGRVEGVYVGDYCVLTNSNIIAYANYMSNDTRFTSCSVGCNNYGTLAVNNCDIYGVHSGINSFGSLSVDAGTYRGYGHGGIYCSGANKTYRITNATILQAEMPVGYKDLGVGCMQGGVYIGGGENMDNIKVFIDNCLIKADKNPIVLRGTSGEKNNSLYISNTALDVTHIRVDNDTNRIYLGEGCNFEELHIDIPDIVVRTYANYAEYQFDE